MIILKKFIRKLYYLISFLTLMIIFIPSVKANDMFGGTINQDIYSPLRAMTDDSYGNYYIMPSNSAYLWYEPGPVGARTMRVFCFEGQDYLQDHVYAVTIYLTTNTANRVLPADSGNSRRIGIGNSMNASRIAFVNNSAYARSVIYTNYSYDYFDIRWPKTDGSFGLQHFVYSVTYFFVPNISGVGLAVPFQFNSSVSSSSTIYYAGYHLENLGLANNLSSSDIQSIISSSGLATASSQNEIKSSLNQVRQQVTELNNSIDNVNDTLNDDNIDGANSQVDDLLDNDNFNDSTGIQSIINAPLNFINSLSNTCSPINVTIPYIDKPLQIPCIKQELNNHIPLIVPILSIAINGFIVYRILLDLVRIIKNSRNPDDDRIEVLDL